MVWLNIHTHTQIYIQYTQKTRFHFTLLFVSAVFSLFCIFFACKKARSRFQWSKRALSSNIELLVMRRLSITECDQINEQGYSNVWSWSNRWRCCRVGMQITINRCRCQISKQKQKQLIGTATSLQQQSSGSSSSQDDNNGRKDTQRERERVEVEWESERSLCANDERHNMQLERQRARASTYKNKYYTHT